MRKQAAAAGQKAAAAATAAAAAAAAAATVAAAAAGAESQQLQAGTDCGLPASGSSSSMSPAIQQPRTRPSSANGPSVSFAVSAGAAGERVPGELRTWAAPAGSPGDYLPEWLSNTLDFAVVFGGDGTVLWTCHMFGNRSVPPLVPFNLGSLGFLTPFAPAALPRVLGRVVRGARGGARKAC